jgi:hypothetical protein
MAKFHWKTPELIKALQATGFPVLNTGPGGDYDTDELYVQISEEGDGFHISGFTPEAAMVNTGDSLVDVITLSDGRDSRGGLTTNNPIMVKAYADIRIILGKLMENTETWVANHYHDFF